MLTVCLIARHNLLEVLNRVGESFLLQCDASKLIVRIDLVFVDLNRAFKALARGFKLASLLMDQSQIVVGRRIRRIQRRRFQVLFERLTRALRTCNSARSNRAIKQKPSPAEKAMRAACRSIGINLAARDKQRTAIMPTTMMDCTSERRNITRKAMMAQIPKIASKASKEKARR